MSPVIKKTFIWMLSSFLSVSLIAQPTATSLDTKNQKSFEIEQQKSSSSENSSQEHKKKSSTTLSEEQQAKDLEIIMENSDQLEQPFDDHDLEEKSHTASDSESDILYDPNMNYGKGAPVPKPNPLSTKYRNLLAFAASVVIATTGMLVTAKSGGRSPAPGAPKCPS